MNISFTIRHFSSPPHNLEQYPFNVYTNSDGSTFALFFRDSNGFLIRFPDSCDFYVSLNGLDVVATAYLGSDDELIQHLFRNQIAPLARSQQGSHVFHASSVAFGNVSVAFLGRSGMGKSTLACYLASTGHSFLTDDGLYLDPVENGFIVIPNNPSIRLWDDSRDVLIDESRDIKAAPLGITTKSRFLAGERIRFCNQNVPLVAAFLLDSQSPGDQDPIQISKLSGLSALVAWLSNSFLLDVENPRLLATHLSNATSIAKAIPTFGLHYPREFSLLPSVSNKLVDFLSTIVP